MARRISSQEINGWFKSPKGCTRKEALKAKRKKKIQVVLVSTTNVKEGSMNTASI